MEGKKSKLENVGWCQPVGTTVPSRLPWHWAHGSDVGLWTVGTFSDNPQWGWSDEGFCCVYKAGWKGPFVATIISWWEMDSQTERKETYPEGMKVYMWSECVRVCIHIHIAIPYVCICGRTCIYIYIYSFLVSYFLLRGLFFFSYSILFIYFILFFAQPNEMDE